MSHLMKLMKKVGATTFQTAPRYLLGGEGGFKGGARGAGPSYFALSLLLALFSTSPLATG